MPALRPSRLFLAGLAMLMARAIASAQDIPLGAT
jgi:hypothetical protein